MEQQTSYTTPGPRGPMDPRIPLTDTIPLDGLGYLGSTVTVVINCTRQFRLDWLRIMTMTPDESANEGFSDFTARNIVAQYQLAPHIIKRIDLKNGDEVLAKEIQTPDDIAWLDQEIDPHIMDLAIGEAMDRAEARVMDTRTGFRTRRKVKSKGVETDQGPSVPDERPNGDSQDK